MRCLAFLLIFLLPSCVFSIQDSTLVPIPYFGNDVKVDGNLNDWPENVFSTTFADTLSLPRSEAELEKFSSYPGEENFDLSKVKKPLSKNSVLVKSFWNFDALYFGFLVHDRHLFAEIPANNPPNLYLNDSIEIFLDTRNDSESRIDINDYHLIVDFLNNRVVFRGDHKLIPIDSLAVPQDWGQNVLFASAATILGDVPDTAEEDSVYVIELAIPFAAIGLEARSGMKMKWDICNNDVDYSFENSVSEVDTLQNYWPFNWVGLSDFGYPYLWKTIQLVGEPDLLEVVASKINRNWLILFFAALATSIVVMSSLFLRLNNLKKMPRFDEIPPATVVFLKAKPMIEEVLTANQKILQKATDFIIENKSEGLRSEKVAKHLALSLRNFQRITRAELSCTPTNFVYMVKLNLATEFLERRQGNVTEAAYAFGFSDASYFSKIFKKHFGVAPFEYQSKKTSNS